MILGGFQIYTNPHMTEHVQYSRSPARAKRRARKGYRQHWVTRAQRDFIIDHNRGTIHCHPAMLSELRRALDSLKATQ